MDVVARPTILRAPALRPLLILLLIGLLIAARLALYAGTQRTRLPAPFGPARNGVIVISTVDQDIAAYDPVSGTTTTLIGGATKDIAPMVLPGRAALHVRSHLGGDTEPTGLPTPTGLGPASSCRPGRMGSNGRTPETGSSSSAVTAVATETSIVNVATGRQRCSTSAGIEHPFWRPGHDQIVFTTQRGRRDSATYYLVNADGTQRTDRRRIAVRDQRSRISRRTARQPRLPRWQDGTGHTGPDPRPGH